jgi:hypothetical protein
MTVLYIEIVIQMAWRLEGLAGANIQGWTTPTLSNFVLKKLGLLKKQFINDASSKIIIIII